MPTFLEWRSPAAQYDRVVTHFFLDACTSVAPDFLDELPVFAAAEHVVPDVGLLELALPDRVDANALTNVIDNHPIWVALRWRPSALVCEPRCKGRRSTPFLA